MQPDRRKKRPAWSIGASNDRDIRWLPRGTGKDMHARFSPKTWARVLPLRQHIQSRRPRRMPRHRLPLAGQVLPRPQTGSADLPGPTETPGEQGAGSAFGPGPEIGSPPSPGPPHAATPAATPADPKYNARYPGRIVPGSGSVPPPPGSASSPLGPAPPSPATPTEPRYSGRYPGRVVPGSGSAPEHHGAPESIRARGGHHATPEHHGASLRDRGTHGDYGDYGGPSSGGDIALSATPMPTAGPADYFPFTPSRPT